MAIKKAFQEIVGFLEENKNSKVSTILETVISMASAKVGGGGKATSFHKNEAGDVTAVKCFYHKLWMSPLVVAFGAKASSATGLSSMCKAGVSKWSKQQRDYKKGKEDLLEQIASGELDQTGLKAALADLEAAKNVVEPMEDGYGFETLEDCLADLNKRGIG